MLDFRSVDRKVANTETPIFDGAPEQAKQYFINDCPSGRMGKAEECAYLALFLASDLARYINGAVIPVDGALSAGAKNVTMWKHPEILKMYSIKLVFFILKHLEIMM